MVALSWWREYKLSYKFIATSIARVEFATAPARLWLGQRAALRAGRKGVGLWVLKQRSGLRSGKESLNVGVGGVAAAQIRQRWGPLRSSVPGARLLHRRRRLQIRPPCSLQFSRIMRSYNGTGPFWCGARRPAALS
jgi:hypothetical protein